MTNETPTDRIPAVAPITKPLPVVRGRDRLSRGQRRVADLLDAHLDGRLGEANLAAHLMVAGHRAPDLADWLGRLRPEHARYQAWAAQDCTWDLAGELCPRCRRTLQDWWDARDAAAIALTGGME
ncbi:hypothetical protein [Enterococcus hirae]|uniref:hypothetical protein n=1 Tax=Enterococcus hirae TaxID=1354 RepID=UPI0013722CC9|nr:hypothetical protein [Enterococcus hirae]NAE18035.1 hypothetical protein [Enterococcus hirae]